VAHFTLRSIFHELRRRRLFNTIALYVVAAWAALQVAELALPGLGIDDYAIRYVWIGAFLLFPLVLVFGWRYDISAGGIKRTPSAAAADETPPLRRVDYGIIGVLSSIALVVITLMGIRISQVEPEPAMAAVENSIAVLPFETCEDFGSDRAIAGGLTMEVINRLAERGKLKVIAHASSYTLAGMGQQKQQIAKPLGVQYLVSGKLCRYQGDLTLAAELFDEQGFVVWADSYVQKVNQWDQITGRLATLVAGGVAGQLGDVAQARDEAPVNRFAYEQLLIGKQYWDRGDKAQARIAFERAIEYDPEYTEAQFYRVMLDTQGYLDEGREESIAKAKPIVKKVLDLARRKLQQHDRSAEAHFMVAQLTAILTRWDEELAFRWNHAGGLGVEGIARLQREITAGYAESERHFRSAIALNPSLTRAYTWLADVIEYQGIERRAEALELLEAGQVRDPFNLSYNARIAKRWAGRGRYRQAIELLERFRSLPVIPPEAWWWELELMQLQVYWDEKAETLVDMLRNDPGAFDDWGNRWQAWWFVSSLAELGLYDEAEAWKTRLEHMPMWDWSRRYGLQNYNVALASKPELRQADATPSPDTNTSAEIDHEIEVLETTRHQRPLWHERAPRDDLTLAAFYQQQGLDDKANALLEEIVAYLEAEYTSGVRHWETLYHLSEAYARLGRDQDAMGMRRKSYEYHGLLPCFYFEEQLTDSPWPRFRSDISYQDLCARIQADFEQQAVRVRTILARYDPDELLAPLIELAKKE